MKKIFFFFLVFYMQLYSENKNYYHLLPEVNDNPDLTFIVGRIDNSMTLHEDFLQMISDTFTATTFIETGSYLGDTAQKASHYFPCVHTIELSEKLFEKIKQRFENKEINLHYGDSTQILPLILKDLKEPPIIFLDSHYCLGETAKGFSNTPILSELQTIKESKISDAIILINEVRLFYNPISKVFGTFLDGYPSLNSLIEKLFQINNNYKCALLFDTLIVYPSSYSVKVSPLIRALTLSRLYDGQNNFNIKDVLLSELYIAQANGKEKEAISTLAELYTEKWGRSAGLSRHFPLWQGLIHMAHEEYEKAYEQFNEAKKRGLTHWRIDWYMTMAETQCFFSIQK